MKKLFYDYIDVAHMINQSYWKGFCFGVLFSFLTIVATVIFAKY